MDFSLLISRILGYKKLSYEIPALKYGRRLESQAIANYKEIKVNAKHTSFQISECGLFVHPEFFYIGASPDSLVQCLCCGEGVLEVKCPLSCAGKKPSAQTVSYIIANEDGEEGLNRKHKYYAQIQGQMALTGRTWADFYVYTPHGHFYEKIEFDSDYWKILLSRIQFFFHNFLAEELVLRGIQSRGNFSV